MFSNINIFRKPTFPLFGRHRARMSYLVVLYLSFALFLSIYNPFFAVSDRESTFIQTLTASLFVSLISVACAAITLLVLYAKKIKKGTFKVYDYVIMCAMNVLFSSVIFSIESVNITDYIDSYKFSCVIAIIPYTVATLYSTVIYLVRELIEERKNLALEKDKQGHKVSMIPFTDEYNNVAFYLERETILYIEANDNYVNIYYHAADRVLLKTLRSSMKSIEEHILPYGIIRCHRSYIVNPVSISMITKSKGKYLLTLKGCDFLVPVSSSFAPKIESLIGNSPLNTL